MANANSTGAPVRADHLSAASDNDPVIPRIPGPRKPGVAPSLLDRAMVTAKPPANSRLAAVFFGAPASGGCAIDRPIPYTLTDSAEQLHDTESMSDADLNALINSLEMRLGLGGASNAA
jgi:hypothetical protein